MAITQIRGNLKLSEDEKLNILLRKEEQARERLVSIQLRIARIYDKQNKLNKPKYKNSQKAFKFLGDKERFNSIFE